MFVTEKPALILAPMDGITDAPMRAVQGETGAFTFAVTEFLRVSTTVLPRKVFYRDVPELCTGGRTPTGLPVQVQLLGGDAERMAKSAVVACKAGAKAIDINFGCPAPTVNRHDGGATLLKYPERIREIVTAVRAAVPTEIPVSAKLRLGWDTTDAIFENAARAAEGGAAWITIHARTRTQGYKPPVYWKPIGQVREMLGGLPVVANGDIWTIDDFRRCRDETGCRYFMLGRGALANPLLPHQAAQELGIGNEKTALALHSPVAWIRLLRRLLEWTEYFEGNTSLRTVFRLKQWVRLASTHGDFSGFEALKQTQNPADFFTCLAELPTPNPLPEGKGPMQNDVSRCGG